MLAADTERRQAVQNGLLEASNRRELWIDVQRIPIPHQPIQRREIRARFLLYHSIRRPVGRVVSSSRSATVGRLLRSSETAGAADEGDAFVVEDLLPGAVEGAVASSHQRGIALVHYFDEVRRALQRAGGGDGPLLDLQVLFSVQEHALVVVWHDILHVVGSFRMVCRDYTKCREDHEVVGAFEDEW